MSLHPQPSTPVPPQTRQVAQAAFPRGNRYMQLRDTLGTLYDDALFADLFPQRGQAAQAPWQLAVVTLLQFAENLSDRQAADAVRSRIDWKYLQHVFIAAAMNLSRIVNWLNKVPLAQTRRATFERLMPPVRAQNQFANSILLEEEPLTGGATQAAGGWCRMRRVSAGTGWLSGQDKTMRVLVQRANPHRQIAQPAIKQTLTERTFFKRYGSWPALHVPSRWPDEGGS